MKTGVKAAAFLRPPVRMTGETGAAAGEPAVEDGEKPDGPAKSVCRRCPDSLAPRSENDR